MHETSKYSLDGQNVLFLVNPTAGNGLSKSEKSEVRDVALLVQSLGNTVDINETSAPNHATEIARSAQVKGIDSIIVVGGDGTLNEVIQATADTNTVVGNIPTGFFNIWAHETNIPTDIKKAGEELMKGQTKMVDVGKINDTLFLQFANLGFDSEEYMKVHKPHEVRRHSGIVTFGETFLRCMKDGWGYRGHPAAVLQHDQEYALNNLLIGVISNSRKYGPLVLNPEIKLNDGKFDMAFFEGENGMDFVKEFVDVVRHKENPGFRRSILSEGEELVINSEDEIGITVEGNPLEYANSIRVKMLPQAQKIIVPRNVPAKLFLST